jgi:hypothetical protein
MKVKSFIAVVMLFFAIQSVVQADDVREKLRFKPGHSSTAKEGCVVGAGRDEYSLEARQGQTMTVSIESEADNAVFEIYYLSGGILEPVEGAASQDGDGAVRYWKGALPGEDGELTRYKIRVGKVRGNACYTLTVRID